MTDWTGVTVSVELAVPPAGSVRLIEPSAMPGLLDVTGVIVAVKLTLPEKPLTLDRLITIVTVEPLSIDRLLTVETLKPGVRSVHEPRRNFQESPKSPELLRPPKRIT